MRALVTGATGFIGQALLQRLQSPVVLTRNPERSASKLQGLTVVAWPDPSNTPPPAEVFEGVEVVFHLAGESVAGRWSNSKKERILRSREAGTRNLVAAMRAAKTPPQVLIASSAVGFYGDRGDAHLTESSAAGDDFLADVCQRWEAEAQKATELGVRVVNIRTGIVLGHGGALQRMLLPFKLCLGGRLGSGKQWMPWIHIDDLVDLMLLAACSDSMHGPVNGVAPQPETNLTFTKTLAGILRRPAIFPVPAFVLRLLLGGFAGVLLGSQRVQPDVAQAKGFKFRYAELLPALQALLVPKALPQHKPSAEESALAS